MDPKEISLHFLLHLNEDFDDDLLQDAIDLLHFKWSWAYRLLLNKITCKIWFDKDWNLCF